MPKPLRYGFPHWIVADSPMLQVCEGGIYRAAILLAFAYWRANCRPLPQDDVTLAALCRLPVPTMRQHKTRALQAFEEMQAALDHEWAYHRKIHDKRSSAARKARAVRKINLANVKSFTQTPQAALPKRLDTPHTPHVPDNTPQAFVINARQGNSATSSAENPPKPPKKPTSGFTD